MKLLKPSFEILEQQPGIDGIYKMIESAGRTCYRSEDKITPDSAAAFADRMIKSGHGAMLEHGTVYLKIGRYNSVEDRYIETKYEENPYSVVNYNGDNWTYYITTNLRVLVENGWMDDLKYICEPTEYHEKRITVRFICDRGVSHEFVRHRVFSFAQESTRYCNYSKDKFGNEITFTLPCWVDEAQLGNHNSKDIIEEAGDVGQWAKDSEISELVFLLSLAESEERYLSLLNLGWKPQQARAVLPNSLKTELVMTGFTSDWEHFFELRDAGSAHPQAQELAKPLHEEFIKRGYINDGVREENL